MSKQNSTTSAKVDKLKAEALRATLPEFDPNSWEMYADEVSGASTADEALQALGLDLGSASSKASGDDAANDAKDAAEKIAAAIAGLNGASDDAAVSLVLDMLARFYGALTPDCERTLGKIMAATGGKSQALKNLFRARLKILQDALKQAADDAREADDDDVSTSDPAFQKALLDYNERFVLVMSGGSARIVPTDLENGLRFYPAKDFLLMTGNERFGAEKHRVNSAWLQWEGRRTCAKGPTFRPYGVNVEVHTRLEEIETGQFNLWNGWQIKSVAGDWSALRGHLFHNVCRENPFWFAWLMSWLADIVQDPGNKKGSAVVLKGVMGTGKSKTADWFRKLMPHNSNSVAKSDQVTGRFNRHQAAMLFCCMEEAFWAGDKGTEGVIKDMITSADTMIEGKFADAFLCPNFTRYWICSNEDWIIPATENDRRFFVLEISDARKNDEAYFKAIDAQMYAGGLEALMHDLAQFKQPTWVTLRKPPRTPWLENQIAESLPAMNRWWSEVLAEGALVDFGGPPKANAAGMPTSDTDEPLVEGADGSVDVDRGIAFDAFKAFAREHGGGSRFKPTAGKLMKFFKDMGAEVIQTRDDDSRRRVYRFAGGLDGMRAAFHKRFGGADAGADFDKRVPEGLDASELAAWAGYGRGGALPSE